MRRLASLATGPTTFSDLYRTPAFPAGSGPDFVNAAVAFDSPDAPEAILDHLHGIEAEFDRERRERWGGRTLDLDLIACGDLVAPDRATWTHWHDLPPDRQRLETPDRLILPHPRMQDRGFVLIPLRDVAPDWRHPVLRRNVAGMCADLSETERQSIVRLPDSPCVQGPTPI